MRRIIITSQDILCPENNREKIYEYDINEAGYFAKSFKDFGVSETEFGDWQVLLGTLPNGDDYECRIIALRDSSVILIYKEILITNQ